MLLFKLHKSFLSILCRKDKVEIGMDIFIPHIIVQLCMFVLIAYGIYLLTYKNDMRTQKQKKREIITGIILISLGSVVIFLIWLLFFITYKRPIQLYTPSSNSNVSKPNLDVSKYGVPLK